MFDSLRRWTELKTRRLNLHEKCTPSWLAWRCFNMSISEHPFFTILQGLQTFFTAYDSTNIDNKIFANEHATRNENWYEYCQLVTLVRTLTGWRKSPCDEHVLEPPRMKQKEKPIICTQFSYETDEHKSMTIGPPWSLDILRCAGIVTYLTSYLHQYVDAWLCWTRWPNLPSRSPPSWWKGPVFCWISWWRGLTRIVLISAFF